MTNTPMKEPLEMTTFKMPRQLKRKIKETCEELNIPMTAVFNNAAYKFTLEKTLL